MHTTLNNQKSKYLTSIPFLNRKDKIKNKSHVTVSEKSKPLSPSSKNETNTVMKIIQKNIKLPLQVDDNSENSKLSETKNDRFPTPDLEEFVPLESVLLDEDTETLFPDSVDFSDLKVKKLVRDKQ